MDEDPQPMSLPSDSKELAHRLLAWEARAGEAPKPTEPLPLRVYEKLRRRITFLAGVLAFQSLASRALTLAKSDGSGLSAMQIASDGSLLGLGEPNVEIDGVRNQWDNAETVLIARLLELLLIFLGEALMWNLISDLWPDATLGDNPSENGRNA